MLQVTDIKRPGLQPVSFELAPGQALAVTGASGAGKTLLLRAIADLDPNDGQLVLDGVARSDLPAPQWRCKVGFVPAESGWWGDTVGDHFAAGSLNAEALERIGLPGEAGMWSVTRLSTGERQRLSLLRMLLLQPRVLLLDEPTAALDAESTRHVEAELKRHLAADGYLVFVSHDRDQVARLADLNLPLENGRPGNLEGVR